MLRLLTCIGGVALAVGAAACTGAITDHGSHNGSGKLFRFLGAHLVNDHVHLHVKIQAIRIAN